MAIYGYIHPKICIWDVWTCIFDVWTCIWVSGLVFVCLDLYLGVWTCICVSGLVGCVYGVRASQFIRDL